MNAILVTGAGGAAGVAVIRHLSARGERTVAVDTDPLAAGLFLADACRVVPSAADPQELVEALAEAVTEHGVDAIVCTVAEEMAALWAGRDALGAPVWLPRPQAVDCSLDKYRFAQVMHQAGLPTPMTALGRDPAGVAEVPGPWIVKPRWGRGSRDVFAVDDCHDLAWPCRRIEHPIVQHRVPGREFTVDVLTDRAGCVVGAVPRWRIECKAGISTKGRTFADAEVIETVTAVIAAVGIDGVANVQGFVGDEGVVIVEVNPRFSGGLPLSIAAGADIVGEFVRATRGGVPDPDALRFRPGVTMTRHLVEEFS